MTKAYAIKGLHYCEMCFLELIVNPNDDWAHDLITATDFPNEPVPCEHCPTEDVFDRAVYTTLDLGDESWLIPWPTEPGSYWFHGWLNGDDGSLPRTFLVEIVRVHSGNIITSTSRLVGLTEGVVVSRSIACGVWHPRLVTLPVPPQAPSK